ncbi:uncharacterized protein N7459_001085 [Penicillium hispanicum]|uniref:uncharacterized protein n=1 Tax=Penicillium hispanicum TaxID=1080232 RepID=UPI002540E520|nr:uncharacterized protein N7459_001085 [Penicillium hispanicum]KAJ5594877.1 hypothetical protein N7459_001085 [Penicillium hispanicum]
MAFSESDIPDLSGKIAIVTGGNSGIGLQTAKVLARRNAHVYLACRTREKYEAALSEIHRMNPGIPTANICFLELDLSSLARAKRGADRFTAQEKDLHILYNTAGVMGTPKGKVSSDGYEYIFAVNTLALFVFTQALLPTLESTASSSPPGTVRIINTASSGAGQASRAGIPLHDPTIGAGMSPFQCYGHSKIGVVLLTRQFAKRHPHILSFAPHPGPVQSNLIRELRIPGPVLWVLNRIVFKPVSYGALTQLYAGTAPSLTGKENGSYMVPLAKIGSKLPHPQCSDDAFGDQLWEWCKNEMKKLGVGI